MLTPIAKSWPSEWCLEANSLAIQVLGGYGYTRDFPVEQYWRDNRLNMIHEGTHGIQALDLLGRKVVMGDGAGLDAALRDDRGDHRACARRASRSRRMPTRSPRAVEQLVAATRAAWETGSPQEALANATPYLQAFGHVVLAWIWLDVAICAAGVGRRRGAARPARRLPLLLPLRAAEDRRLARRGRAPRRHLPDDGRGLVLKLLAGRIEALVWVLIYGGLLVFGLGVALSRGGLDYGWSVSVVGIVIAVAGVVLIYVRSRMSDRTDA